MNDVHNKVNWGPDLGLETSYAQNVEMALGGIRI